MIRVVIAEDQSMVLSALATLLDIERDIDVGDVTRLLDGAILMLMATDPPVRRLVRSGLAASREPLALQNRNPAWPAHSVTTM
jgi:hypothetical protein